MGKKIRLKKKSTFFYSEHKLGYHFLPLKSCAQEYAHTPAWAALQIKCWQETYASFMNPFYLKNLDHCLQEWTQQKLQVLCDTAIHKILLFWQEQLIGFCEAGPPRPLQILQEQHFQKLLTIKGEILRIYILNAHQGKGLGRQLFLKAAQWLTINGQIPFRVWAFEKNAMATLFYQKMGGIPEKRGKYNIAGDKYHMISYYFIK